MAISRIAPHASARLPLACRRHCQLCSTQFLLLDCVEVARLSQRVDDQTCWVSLNSQREAELRKAQLCSRYEQGVAGAEMWAEWHQARPRAEVDEYLIGRKVK